MKQTFTHRGYSGSVEVSLEDNCLHGKILFVRDLVTYEAETIEQLRTEFAAAVDDYLETCKELGVRPDKPFSGSFNVRIGEDLHQKAAKAAYQEDITLNEYVARSVQERVERAEQQQVVHHHHHHFSYHQQFSFQQDLSESAEYEDFVMAPVGARQHRSLCT